MHAMLSGFIVAVVLAGASIAPAGAEPRDPSELSGFTQAIRSASLAQRGELPPGPVMEGRNASVTQPSATGLEPYIARTIERSARGNR